MADLIVGLDIGTTKVCAVVGEMAENGLVDVVGIGTRPSHGMRKGVVVNIEQTVQSIRGAIEDAELMAGCEINSVYVGIAGGHIAGINSHGVIAVKGGEVGQRDVERALDAARAVAIPADREVIHILPQEYIVDNQRGIADPLGMAGVTPTIFGLASASSTSVFPNTSWKSGGIPSVLAMKRSPVTGSNLPGACHSVACFSAGPNPFPLIVCRCRILGPCISLISRNTLARFFTSCPSIGPK